MIKFFFRLLLVTSALFSAAMGFGQPARSLVQVIVAPDHDDWTYSIGENAVFSIQVLRNNVPLTDVNLFYEYGKELMSPDKSGSLTIKKGKTEIKVPSLSEPGFLRLTAWVEVDGQRYSSYATAGYAPYDIKPSAVLPSDFKAFWESSLSELGKVPVNPVMTLLPDRCTDKVDVYHVRIANIAGYMYGILAMPREKGEYPALLQVPGAGIRSYSGDIETAAKGVITFQIGIHGLPVNLPQSVYDDLRAGALQNYITFGLDDRDRYYYKRVYLGCVRAVDFLCSLENFDGENLAVTGGSQGGALSIVTAGLDNRVKYLAAFYPALSDLTGHLNGRAGGWPHLFRDAFTKKDEKIKVSAYFDVVNFARFVKAEGWYSWGFNDNVCPPTSMFPAYNVITAPKQLVVFQETQHWTFPEQRELSQKWLLEKLMK